MSAIGPMKLFAGGGVLLLLMAAGLRGQTPAGGTAVDSPTEITPASIPTTLPTLSPEETQRLSRAGRVHITSFSFKGNTAFSSKELAAIAQPFLKTHLGYLNNDDLEAIRTALTKVYIDAGYINSGAVLPDQTIGPDGIVDYRIVEGRLSAIHLNKNAMHSMENMTPTSQPAELPAANGTGQAAQPKLPPAPGAGVGPTATPQPGPGSVAREAAAPLPTGGGGINWHLLHDSYITDRVQLGAGTPLNVLHLKDELELLRRDPNIKTINGELAPGDQAGESILDLSVTERNPFQIGLEFANNRPPSVGAYEMNLLASDSDLTGVGDSLSAKWGVVAGASDSLEYNQDHDLSFDYIRPLNAHDLTMEINYTRSSDLVVEQPFQAVGITSRTESVYGTLRRPIIRTVEDKTPDPNTGNPELDSILKQHKINTSDQELDAFFTVSSRSNKTYLLGEPFSFSPGANNGSEDTFALRPGFEYVRRSASAALSLRSTFSFGLGNAFNSTLNHDGTPDSRFFAFLGQVQYAHRLPLGNVDQPWYDTQGILRFNTQLTPNRLLTLEQFSLGGVDTVRGYRENQLVTDMAAQASAELQIPIAKSHQRDILTVIPFFDTGYAWNRDNSTTAPEYISSVGAGMAFTPNEHINARVYYGYRLKQFSHTGNDLQDMGIHFDVTILGF
jgi:hemolysin activation/secretion protein